MFSLQHRTFRSLPQAPEEGLKWEPLGRFSKLCFCLISALTFMLNLKLSIPIIASLKLKYYTWAICSPLILLGQFISAHQLYHIFIPFPFSKSRLLRNEQNWRFYFNQSRSQCIYKIYLLYTNLNLLQLIFILLPSWMNFLINQVMFGLQ